ncbi:hypothetical protein Misp01_77280 [Microtetraspora sp. NBRC 13810]|nr:hypothetical protein Misp01_77280 [Microtetraspora sp. NBRC 13810]
MVAIPQELPGSPEYLKRLRYAWRVCSVTSLGLILIGISGNTLNVALPTVVRHFHANASAAGWILLSFLLVNTATLVFFGRVADLLGRREIYLTGFGLFIVASLLAGLSPGVGFLIAMRAVQAVGAAMILANGTVIITDAFPPDRLSQGMGVYIGTLSVAQLAGPTLGGLVAEAAGWQWIFWMNVPAGLIALVWGMMTLRKVPRGPREPVDALGNMLIFAVLLAAVTALHEAGSGSLTGPVVIIGGGVALRGCSPSPTSRPSATRSPVPRSSCWPRCTSRRPGASTPSPPRSRCCRCRWAWPSPHPSRARSAAGSPPIGCRSAGRCSAPPGC